MPSDTILPRDLFLSRDLRVRFVDVPGDDRRACVVTFASFTDRETLDRPGFGEAFLASRGIPAIHVISRQNLWYQEPETPAAMAAAREVSARYGRVVSYGSSMGGFAAIRFGAAAGATVALALSPQYSVERAEAPFERRWRAHSARVRFRHPVATLPSVERVYLFYDPRDVDRHHARLIAERYPTSAIRLPFAGHPVGSLLNETGLLAAAVEAIVADRFDAAAVEREVRARRRGSGHYLFALAHRLGTHHLPAKLALAERAVAATPDEPTYHGFRALVLERSRRWRDAEASYRAAVGPASDRPAHLELFARSLLRQGRVAEARALADEALRLSTGASRSLRTAGLAHLAAGEPAAGLRRIWRGLRAEPQHGASSLREIGAVLLWRLLGRRKLDPEDGAAPALRLPYGPELTRRRLREDR